MPKREKGSVMEGYNKVMSPAQILEAAKDEGYELSEEELDAVSGGSWHPCWDNCLTDGY